MENVIFFSFFKAKKRSSTWDEESFGGKCQNLVIQMSIKIRMEGFPGVHWLRLHAPTAGGTCLIPGLVTKIPHVSWCGQKKKKDQNG